MAKLSDLIDTGINTEVVKIQGVNIPIMFAMETFNHVQNAYGKPYKVFEQDLNRMLMKKGGKVQLGNNEMKIMYALIYGMVRTGGTDCTLQEIRGGTPIGDLQEILQKVLDVFNEQDFQEKDMSRLKRSKEKK
ncbi:MAG: hypothetical protein ACOYEB_00620 [Enterococcus lemanii]